MTCETGRGATPPAHPRPRSGTNAIAAGYWHSDRAGVVDDTWTMPKEAGTRVSHRVEAKAVKQGSQKQALREWNELLRRDTLTVDQARWRSGNDLDSIIGSSTANSGCSESFSAKILSTGRQRSTSKLARVERADCWQYATALPALNVLTCDHRWADKQDNPVPPPLQLLSSKGQKQITPHSKSRLPSPSCMDLFMRTVTV